MDFGVVVALALVVTCGVEGCSVPPSHSLSLYLLSGRRTVKSLQCLLCLDRRAFSQRNYTFTLTRNGKEVKFSQTMDRKIWYLLDDKKNNSGLWRCNVQEFPDLRAEYYLVPPTPDPSGLKKADSEASVPAPAMSTRILLTIMTAALLLIMLTIVIFLTSGILIMKQRRRTSASRQHRQDRKRSDNFPLTENVSSDLGLPKLEPDTEVSYVELEIIRDPFRKPSKSHNTIYANIM